MRTRLTDIAVTLLIFVFLHLGMVMTRFKKCGESAEIHLHHHKSNRCDK